MQFATGFLLLLGYATAFGGHTRIRSSPALGVGSALETENLNQEAFLRDLDTEIEAVKSLSRKVDAASRYAPQDALDHYAEAANRLQCLAAASIQAHSEPVIQPKSQRYEGLTESSKACLVFAVSFAAVSLTQNPVLMDEISHLEIGSLSLKSVLSGVELHVPQVTSEFMNQVGAQASSVKESIQTQFMEVKDAISLQMDVMKDALPQQFQGAKNTFLSHWSALQTGFDLQMDRLQDASSSQMNFLGESAVNAFDIQRNNLHNTIQDIQESSAIVSAKILEEQLPQMMGKIHGTLGSAVQSFQSMCTGVQVAFQTTTDDLQDRVPEFMHNLESAAAAQSVAFQTVLDNAEDSFGSSMTSLQPTLADMQTEFKSSTDDLQESILGLMNKFESAIAAKSDSIQSVIHNAEDSLSTAIDDFQAQFPSYLNMIQGTAADLQDSVEDSFMEAQASVGASLGTLQVQMSDLVNIVEESIDEQASTSIQVLSSTMDSVQANMLSQMTTIRDSIGTLDIQLPKVDVEAAIHQTSELLSQIDIPVLPTVEIDGMMDVVSSMQETVTAKTSSIDLNGIADQAKDAFHQQITELNLNHIAMPNFEKFQLPTMENLEIGGSKVGLPSIVSQAIDTTTKDLSVMNEVVSASYLRVS